MWISTHYIFLDDSVQLIDGSLDPGPGLDLDLLRRDRALGAAIWVHWSPKAHFWNLEMTQSL